MICACELRNIHNAPQFPFPLMGLQLHPASESNFAKDVTQADYHVEVTRSRYDAEHASIALNPRPPSILLQPPLDPVPGGDMRAFRLALAARHLPLRSTATVASRPAISPLTRRYVTSGSGSGSGSSGNVASRSIARLLEWKPQEEVRDVVVNGFIRSVRSMKSRSFVALGDGSSLASLQALVPTNQAQGCGLFFQTACLGLTPFMLTRRLYIVSPSEPPFVSPGPGFPQRAPASPMSSTSRPSKFWVLPTPRCIAVPLVLSLQAC